MLRKIIKDIINFILSAAKAALGMQMSVSQSFFPALSFLSNLQVNFIIANQILQQFLEDLKPFNLSQHTCTMLFLDVIASLHLIASIELLVLLFCRQKSQYSLHGYK